MFNTDIKQMASIYVKTEFNIRLLVNITIKSVNEGSVRSNKLTRSCSFLSYPLY